MVTVVIAISIDGRGLSDRLAALASIGEIEGTDGACRLALTDEDRAGRDLVVAWMRDLGLDVSIDGIGNVVGALAGAEPGPPVRTVSMWLPHITGGRWRWGSSPMRRAPGSRPTCWAAWCTPASWP